MTRKHIIIFSLILVFIAFMFPPWKVNEMNIYSKATLSEIKYSFVFTPPTDEINFYRLPLSDPRIDWNRLSMEIVIILVLAGFGFVLAKKE